MRLKKKKKKVYYFILNIYQKYFLTEFAAMQVPVLVSVTPGLACWGLRCSRTIFWSERMNTEMRRSM